MKKIPAILLVIALSLSVFGLIGCGEGGSGLLSGKFVVTTLEDNGEEMDYAAALVLLGHDPAEVMYLEFRDNGRCKLLIFGGIEAEGTYEVSGNKLTLNIDGQRIEGEARGNKVSITTEGGKLNFEKQ